MFGGGARPTVAVMDAAPAPEKFGTTQLFLADSRLALLVLNYARLAVIRSVFGVSREQANLLTFVLALGAAETAYATASRVLRTPLRVREAHVGIAALALRETALGIAGPAARETPGFGPLLAVGVLGGLALPAVRRVTRALRDEERRTRLRRASRYSAARRGLAAD
jgi:hypothetical protein